MDTVQYQEWKLAQELTAAGVSHGAKGVPVVIPGVKVETLDHHSLAWCFIGNVTAMAASPAQLGDGGPLAQRVDLSGDLPPRQGTYRLYATLLSANGVLRLKVDNYERMTA